MYQNGFMTNLRLYARYSIPTPQYLHLSQLLVEFGPSYYFFPPLSIRKTYFRFQQKNSLISDSTTRLSRHRDSFEN